MGYHFEISNIQTEEVIYECSYTSNVYNILQDAFNSINKVPLYNHWSDMLNIEQSADYLKDLIKELKQNKHKYEQLNPPNGWGSYQGILECLQEIFNVFESRKDKNLLQFIISW